MQIIDLFGPPAAGKGTQAAFLQRQGHVVFSPSTYLRARVQINDATGQLIKAKMDAGELAPDDVVDQGVREAVEAQIAAGAATIVLDGYPRTMAQAGYLDNLAQEKNADLIVLSFEVDEAILNQRRQKRYDDAVAAGQTPRKDDVESVFLTRMAIYHQQTAPILAHYTAKGLLKPIDATGAPDDVNLLVQRLLKPAKPAAPVPAAPAP
jgi:adenylate kinase